MSDNDQQIRERAYLLWEQAGRPEGRGEEFWFLAQQEIYGGITSDGPEGVLQPPAQQPPATAARYGVPIGRPGERIAEQGVLDGEGDDLAIPTLVDTEDD